jgi:hypothetical protein
MTPEQLLHPKAGIVATANLDITVLMVFIIACNDESK